VAEGQARVRDDVLALGLLAVVVAIFFRDVLFGGGVFFVQDMMVQNVPFAHYLHDALREGRLPLWEPRINMGYPLFAEGQVGALYPPNWLGLLTSPARAVSLAVVGHLWLAAAGICLFLRRGLGASHAGALLAGLVYGLGGYLVVRAMSPNFVAAAAWLPWGLWVVEWGLRQRRPVGPGVAGGIAALGFLAGHPQAAVYGNLIVAAYALSRAVQLDAWGVLWRGAGLALPGIAVAAVQVLPTMDLAGRSLRAGGIDYEQFVSMSLPPERLLTLWLPSLFGNSAHGSYWGAEAGFFIQLCAYVGVLTLPLAVIGARAGAAPARGFFALVAVLGLCLSLGRYTGLFEALYGVPGLSQFRIPTRFLLWWALGAAVLAGLGLDRLMQRPVRRSALGPGLAAGLLLCAAAAWLAWSRAPVEDGLLAHWRHDLTGDGLRLGVVLGAAAIALWLRRLHAVAAAAVLVAAMAWDLHDMGGDFNGTLPARTYTQPPPAALAIHADAARLDGDTGAPAPGRFRVASLISENNAPYDWHGGWAYDRRSYGAYPKTLRMYSAGLFGLANTLPGWSPLHPRTQWEFVAGFPQLLGLANVGYLVTHEPPSPSMATVIHRGDVVVSRLHGRQPRARVVPGWRVLDDAHARRDYLRSAAFDPAREVVLEADPGVPVAAGQGRAARLVAYEAERVVVDLPGQAGLLLLADSHDPGWEARVDGELRPVLRANHTLRAVAVQADDDRVEFRYRPVAVVRGAWISSVALALWVGLCLWGRRWTCPTGATEGPSVPLALVWQVGLILLLHGAVTETGAWRDGLRRLDPGAAPTSAGQR
jgi:hypothetical protein